MRLESSVMLWIQHRSGAIIIPSMTLNRPHDLSEPQLAHLQKGRGKSAADLPMGLSSELNEPLDEQVQDELLRATQGKHCQHCQKCLLVLPRSALNLILGTMCPRRNNSVQEGRYGTQKAGMASLESGNCVAVDFTNH